jgi:hypothetical protein
MSLIFGEHDDIEALRQRSIAAGQTAEGWLAGLASAADQLLAAYLIAHPDKMPSDIKILELIAWGNGIAEGAER